MSPPTSKQIPLSQFDELIDERERQLVRLDIEDVDSGAFQRVQGLRPVTNETVRDRVPGAIHNGVRSFVDNSIQ